MNLAYTKIYRPRRKKKFPRLFFFAALLFLLLSLNYNGNLKEEAGAYAFLSSVFSESFFQKAQAAD